MQLLKKRILALPNRAEAYELLKAFESLFNTQCLTAANFVTGAGATIATGNAINAVVVGVLGAKASGSTFAMTGPSIPNSGANCQAWIFAMDAAGNSFTFPGVPAASIALVTLPTVPELAPTAPFMPLVVVGSAIMVNTSTGAFVPGTTATNTASLGLTLNSTVGPFFPIQVL